MHLREQMPILDSKHETPEAHKYLSYRLSALTSIFTDLFTSEVSSYKQNYSTSLQITGK